MPRRKSANPARILSVSLPMTTIAKIERFNPRNRSKFINEAIKSWINQHDPETKQLALEAQQEAADPWTAVKMLTDRQVAAVMLARIADMPDHHKQLRSNLQTYFAKALALPAEQNYTSSLYKPPEAAE